MTALKHLLSDEFVSFSTNMADVHNRMKSAKARFQSEMESLMEEAKKYKSDFESWQSQDSPKDPETAAPVSAQNTKGSKT